MLNACKINMISTTKTSDFSGLYHGSYRIFDSERKMYYDLDGGVVLYLKCDSTFLYRQGFRRVWGKGTWHDAGQEILLHFSKISDIESSLLMECNLWYTEVDGILKKSEEGNLIWNLSVLKKKYFRSEEEKIAWLKKYYLIIGRLILYP